MWEITPHYAEKLELEKKDSRYYRPVHAGIGIWQVSCGESTHDINLEARHCGCFKWDLTGIPCKYAMSAIYKSKWHPEDFVGDYFKKPAYVRAYQHLTYPNPREHDWVKTNTQDMDPSKFFKHPGRLKKNRKKGIDAVPRHSGRVRNTTITCSNCGKQGHKYTKCPIPLRPDLKIRKRKHMSNRSIPEESSEEDGARMHVPQNSSTVRGRASKMASRRGRDGERERRGRGGRGRGVVGIMQWLQVGGSSNGGASEE